MFKICLKTNSRRNKWLSLQRWNHLELHVVKDGKGQNDGLCPWKNTRQMEKVFKCYS